jgi:hypothetical protein
VWVFVSAQQVHFATCQTSLAQSHFEAVVDLLGQEAIARQLQTNSDNVVAAVRAFANIQEPLSSRNSNSNNAANADRQNNGSSSATAAGAAKRRYSVDSLTVHIIF